MLLLQGCTLILISICCFVVTVESLKSKLQKKEREVDSKKQELVRDKETKVAPTFSVQGLCSVMFLSVSKIFHSEEQSFSQSVGRSVGRSVCLFVCLSVCLSVIIQSP